MVSIDGLPVELLAQIFDLSIRDQKYISDTFRISQVCQHWRQVAHGTPQLWSRQIRVTIHSRGSAEADRLYRDGLQTWLRRSQPLPIPLIFNEKRPTTAMHDWGPAAFEAWDPDSPVWDMILEIAPRLRSLSLLSLGNERGNLPLTLPLFKRLARIKPSLDSLEALYLNASDSDPVLPSSILPRLQKLSIVYMLDPKNPLLLNLWPWAQLHDLDLSLSEFDGILIILSKCPNLVRASVAAFAWSAYPSVGQPDITLTHLHTLSLGFDEYSEGHIMPFFDRVSVPALENLVMNFDDCTRIVWNQARFSAFQLRTPTITHLEFTCLHPLSSSDLMAVLQHADHLTHFKVETLNEAFDETIIRALTYTDGSQSLAPCLHHLVLQAPFWRIPDHFGTEFWANMLLSRWWTDEQLASGTIKPTVARWTRIRLRCSQRYKPAIEALQRTGVPIECQYYS